LAALLALLVSCTGEGGSGHPSGPGVTGPEPTPEAEAVVRRTDLRMRFVLEGVSEESSAVEPVWNPALVFVPALPSGTRVRAGEAIGRSRIAPGIRQGLVAGELAQLRSLQGQIRSPVDGLLTLEDGRPVIRARGIDVVVPLLPIQYLRYRSVPFSGQATIETIVGQRSVPCTALWVAVAAGQAPYQLHCRLPSSVETAAGLRAQVVLTSQTFRDVLVVPNIYVGYDHAHDGYYVRILEGGRERRVPITVGITDGVVRVVTSDLPVGATLLPPSDG
jgi:hypothetical protein